MLRDSAIKAEKPSDKMKTLSEGNLKLYIYPTGTKVWYYVFKTSGIKKQIRIGEYPVISLHEARKKAAGIAVDRKQGKDPSKAKLPPLTVASLFDQFFEKHVAPENSKGTYNTRKSYYNRYIAHLDNKLAVDVKRADIALLLQPIRAKRTAHNHTLGLIRKCFNWAIENGLLENNPCYLIKAVKITPRSRILTDKEIKSVLALGDSSTERLLKCALYTGMRQVHLFSAKPDGHWVTTVELKGGSGKEHRHYLVDEVLDMLGFDGQMSSSRLAQFCTRRGFKFQPRDIRRTVSHNLRKMHYSKDVVEAVLGHSEGVLVDTYHLYEYDEEKKDAMTAWAKKLKSLAPSDLG